MLLLSRRLINAQQPVCQQMPLAMLGGCRSFAKPAGKGGPPGQEPTKIPEKRGPTVIEKMIADGTEFVMGPPKVPNKAWNAPRDELIHKLEPHLDVYARKLRDVYIREGTIPQVKSYLNPIRMR